MDAEADAAIRALYQLPDFYEPVEADYVDPVSLENNPSTSVAEPEPEPKSKKGKMKTTRKDAQKAKDVQKAKLMRSVDSMHEKVMKRIKSSPNNADFFCELLGELDQLKSLHSSFTDEVSALDREIVKMSKDSRAAEMLADIDKTKELLLSQMYSVKNRLKYNV